MKALRLLSQSMRNGISQSRILLLREKLDHILSLIDQLPQPHQNVIKFKAEGLQLWEIARRTSMSLPQVIKCLHEGQKQLRQLLHP